MRRILSEKFPLLYNKSQSSLRNIFGAYDPVYLLLLIITTRLSRMPFPFWDTLIVANSLFAYVRRSPPAWRLHRLPTTLSISFLKPADAPHLLDICSAPDSCPAGSSTQKSSPMTQTIHHRYAPRSFHPSKVNKA